jgi:AraC-like DNA-binding protein
MFFSGKGGRRFDAGRKAVFHEMKEIGFYRDPSLPVYEIKSCHSGLHSTRGHFHDEIAAALVERGQSRVECAGGPFLVDRDTLVVFPPGTVHSCNPCDADEWSFRMLFVSPDVLPPDERISFCGAGPRIVGMDHDFRRRIEDAFAVLSGESETGEKEQTLLFLLELVAERISSPSESRNEAGAVPESVSRVADFLHAHFREDLPLDRLSGISGLSRFHLVRAFRRAFDMTPHAFQMVLRIDDSKRLLRSGVPIAEAALETGFYDQSHFTRVFREICGGTPAHYIASNDPE